MCPNPICHYCNRRGHVGSNWPKKRQENDARRASQAPTEGLQEQSRPATSAQGDAQTTGACTGDANVGVTPEMVVEVLTERQQAPITPAPMRKAEEPRKASTRKETANKRKYAGESNEEPPAITVRREQPSVATPIPSTETTTVPETREFS